MFRVAGMMFRGVIGEGSFDFDVPWVVSRLYEETSYCQSWTSSSQASLLVAYTVPVVVGAVASVELARGQCAYLPAPRPRLGLERLEISFSPMYHLWMPPYLAATPLASLWQYA